MRALSGTMLHVSHQFCSWQAQTKSSKRERARFSGKQVMGGNMVLILLAVTNYVHCPQTRRKRSACFLRHGTNAQGSGYVSNVLKD